VCRCKPRISAVMIFAERYAFARSHSFCFGRMLRLFTYTSSCCSPSTRHAPVMHLWDTHMLHSPGYSCAKRLLHRQPERTSTCWGLQVKLMVGEFSSSRKEDEAVLSCQELMAEGASAAAVHANLLCELTSVYKDLADFEEKRCTWLQVIHF
jgi:hypothetical protein